MKTYVHTCMVAHQSSVKNWAFDAQAVKTPASYTVCILGRFKAYGICCFFCMCDCSTLLRAWNCIKVELASRSNIHSTFANQVCT